jgi:hypothetical protein
VLLLPADRERPQLSEMIVDILRRSGLRLAIDSGWDDHDALIAGSFLLRGELVTSGHPRGCVQIQVRTRLLGGRFAFVAGAFALTAWMAPPVGAALATIVLLDLSWGAWRIGPRMRRAITAAADHPC